MAPKKLSVYVPSDELALLKKHEFPGSEAVLKSAKQTKLGIQLSGSRADFEELQGWVAAEANAAEREGPSPEAELFGRLWEELETALLRAPKP